MNCPHCGNSSFLEDVVYKVVEEINFVKKGSEIHTESNKLVSVGTLERFNEFKCIKCNKVYSIGKDKGEEVLVLLE